VGLSLPKILCGPWGMSFSQGGPQASNSLQPYLRLVNKIRRCTRVHGSKIQTHNFQRAQERPELAFDFIH